jgi:hypothetical protein
MTRALVDVLVFTGSGTRPGVDFTDRQTWQRLMDEEDAERFRMAGCDAGSRRHCISPRC